jgi:hypothetical protein
LEQVTGTLPKGCHTRGQTHAGRNDDVSIQHGEKPLECGLDAGEQGKVYHSSLQKQKLIEMFLRPLIKALTNVRGSGTHQTAPRTEP